MNLKSVSFWACIFISLFYICTYNLFRAWQGGSPFVQDVDQYYSYLVAYFIEHDLTFSFDNSYWLFPTEIGHRVPKVSIGMSLVYMPGFLIGHTIAKVTATPVNGYSWPYIWGVYYCSILYSLISFWKLRSMLLQYFGETSTSMTLISISLGTNLLFYVLGIGEMPHNYLLVLYTFSFDQIIKFHNTSNVKHLYILSFLVAIIVLIRPAELIFLVFPLFYNVYSRESLMKKIELIKNISWKWIFVIIIFIGTIAPQLVYWKYMTGSFLYFSYGKEERFFFNNPQVLNFLFSFKKGWLIYTPIMTFSLIGFFYLKKYFIQLKFSLPILLIILIYFLSSWWSWWYGGSYGNRSMIQYYVFLAFPMASLFEQFYKKKIILFSFTTLIVGLISLNIIQTRLYKSGFLHWDSMSRKSYIYLMTHDIHNNFNIDYYNYLLKEPDYEAASKGKYNYRWYE